MICLILLFERLRILPVRNGCVLQVFVGLEPLDDLDLVRVEVQDLQLGQELEVLDLLDAVLREHHDSQGRDRVEVLDVADLVVVEIEIDQIRQRHQILDLRNRILLTAEQLEALLALKQRKVREILLV